MTAIHATEVKSWPPDLAKLSLSPVRMRSYVVGFNESTKSKACSVENVTQTPDAPVTPDASFRRLHCAIIEMIETEDAYVQHLRDLEQGYLNNLRKVPELDADQVQMIFGRIPGLRKFHQMLASALHKHATNMVELARVFINLENQFSVLYVGFCTSYPRALQILQHAERNQTVLWNHLKQCQQSLGHKLTVSNYLLKPVQRILQYRMILQTCSKHSFTVLNFLPEEDIQTMKDPLVSGKITSTGEVRRTLQDAIPLFLEAAEKMEKVGNHINEKKRSDDVIQHLRKIHLEADQWGELVLMDRFRVASKKDWRLVLLFHSAIVLCKYSQSVTSRRPDQLKDGVADRDSIGKNSAGWILSSVHDIAEVPVEIRQIFTCTNLMLIECIPKDPLAFHILPFGNPKAQRTLRAVNISVKELWCREIKRLILENYDAAIPDKVKYILLNTITKHDPEETFGTVNTRKTSENKTNTKFPHPESATSQSYPSGLSANVSTTHTWSTADFVGEVPQSKESVRNTVFLPADLLPDDQSLSTQTELGDIAPKTVNRKLLSVEDCASVSESVESGGIQMPEQNSDFRCIAVEVNEERFLRDAVESERGTSISFAPLSSNGFLPPDTSDILSSTDRFTPPNSTTSSDKQGKAVSRPQNPAETFLYIDYPGIIRHDPVSFDRTYDRYIAKARANLCLSVVDMDEIFRPLLDVFDPGSSPSLFSTRSTSSHPPSVPPHKDKEGLAMNSSEKNQTLSPRRFSLHVALHKTVGADDAVTDCSSPSGPNSGASSPRHVVSQIAFLHSKNQRCEDETNNLTQTIKRNTSGCNGISRKSSEPNPRHQAVRQGYLPNEHFSRNLVQPRSSSLAPLSDSGQETCEQTHRAVSNFRFRTGPPSLRLVDSHSNSFSSLSTLGSTRHNTMHSTGATNRIVTSSSSINRNDGSMPNGREYALKSTSFNTSSGKKPLCSGRLESSQEPICNTGSPVNPSDSPKLTRLGRKKSRAPSPPLSGAPLAQQDEAFLDYSCMEHGSARAATKAFYLDRQRIHRGTLPGLNEFQNTYGILIDRSSVGQRPPVKPPRKAVVLSTPTHEFRPLNQSHESSRQNYQSTSSEKNTIARYKDVLSPGSRQADKIHSTTQKSFSPKDSVTR